VWVIGLAVLGSALTRAAEPDDPEIADLTEQLKSPEAATVAGAVKDIQTRLESDPDGSLGYLRRFWLKPLQEGRKFDLVETLCLRAILAAPQRTGDVEFFQETRIRALLTAGKPQEALSQAKALCNVTGMRNTEKSLLLLAECLKAVHPDDPQVLKKLAREQKGGATTRPASEAPADGGIVASIPVDGSAYQKAIDELVSDDDRSQLAKGNLLLLAGRAQEAQKVFEQLLAHTDASNLMGFHENVARALRAQDGTIGRANGYLLAMAKDNNSKGQP